MSSMLARTDPDATDALVTVRLSRASPPPRLAECLVELRALHRHLCPRQVLGVRMGIYAGELLDLELPRRDKRVFVFVETDGCLADSISVATGCWLGHRTLRLIDHGKAAATFADTRTGRAIRIWPHPAARSRASEYAPEAPDRWHAQRDGYQVMPAAELLRAERVDLDIDLTAIISRPGRRIVCAGCDEDIVNEREVVLGGRAYCRGCAGERYYRVAPAATAGPPAPGPSPHGPGAAASGAG